MEQELPEQDDRAGTGAKAFFLNFLRGIAIGIAFIIPGFSGGSVAAILGIYETIVDAIADLFRSFLKSMKILLPIAAGMAVGAAALLFPIRWGLEHYPIPTVSLFVGLALGGLPSVTEKIEGKGRPTDLFCFLLPCLCAAALAFVPVLEQEENFLLSLSAGGYLLLVLVGMVGACALVVPGISGSMLLLIFGYYTPLVDLLTEHLLLGKDVGGSLLVFLCVGIGILIGFFAVSKLMKFLLKRFPRGTYFAILGLILGSVVSVYAVTVKGSAVPFTDPWYWVIAAVLLIAGNAISQFILYLAKRRLR